LAVSTAWFTLLLVLLEIILRRSELKTRNLKYVLPFGMGIFFLLFSGCSSPTSPTSPTTPTVSSSPIVDATLFVSGYVRPATRFDLISQGTTQANYQAYLYLQDINNATLGISDAVVTVNGVSLPYVSTGTSGNCYAANSIGTLSVGSTVSFIIKQTRVGTLTYTLTVPNILVPAQSGWSVVPGLSAAIPITSTDEASGIVLTPPAAWSSPYGSLWAFLYSDDNIKDYQSYSSWSSLTGTNPQTFTQSNLSYGSPATVAPYITFYAVAQDAALLTGYGESASGSTSKLRIYAPCGYAIESNL
jgi:hypothetical protein